MEKERTEVIYWFRDFVREISKMFPETPKVVLLKHGRPSYQRDGGKSEEMAVICLPEEQEKEVGRTIVATLTPDYQCVLGAKEGLFPISLSGDIQKTIEFLHVMTSDGGILSEGLSSFYFHYFKKSDTQVFLKNDRSRVFPTSRVESALLFPSKSCLPTPFFGAVVNLIDFSVRSRPKGESSINLCFGMGDNQKNLFFRRGYGSSCYHQYDINKNVEERKKELSPLGLRVYSTIRGEEHPHPILLVEGNQQENPYIRTFINGKANFEGYNLEYIREIIMDLMVMVLEELNEK